MVDLAWSATIGIVLANTASAAAQIMVVAAVFRTIFAQPDAEAVSSTWDEVRDQLAARFPKIGPLMDAAKTEVLAFTAFPRAHWRKISSTNPLERINKELKRRSNVVGIFPDDASVISRVGELAATSVKVSVPEVTATTVYVSGQPRPVT